MMTFEAPGFVSGKLERECARWGKTVFIFFILKYRYYSYAEIIFLHIIKWICMLNNLKYRFIKLKIIEPLFFFTYRTIDLSISEQAS
jgi:hypothetical protein